MITTAETTGEVRRRERGVDVLSRCLSVFVLIAVIFATFRAFHGANVPFLALSLAGASLIQFSHDRSLWRVLFTLVSAMFLSTIYTLTGGLTGQYTGAVVVEGLAFLGMGSLLMLGIRAFRSTEELRPLLLASFCPVLTIVTNFALIATIALQPRVFDLYLYRFDAVLGGQASFLMGQWFTIVPALRDACFFVYAALPLVQVAVICLYWRGQRMPANPLITFVVAGVAGFLLYQICPAMGPVHVFPRDFPQIVPVDAQPHALALNVAPRNAMPSLHTAWAILIWWSLRFSSKWIRVAAAAFLGLTLIATLGFGEHYLIDLVVAVPFTLAIQAVSTRQLAPAAGWIGTTIAWCAYLRWMFPVLPVSTMMAWILVVTTMALPGVNNVMKLIPALLSGTGSPIAASGKAAETES